MSANLCSIRTLNALATFAADRNIQLGLNNGDVLQCQANPQRTVDLLLAANLAALRTRYPQDADYKQPHAATFTAARPEEVAPVVMLKLVNYFNYQACEADGYQGSDAAALMRCIIVDAIRRLPGYADAPWGLDGEEPRPVLPEPPAVVEVPRASTGDLFAMMFPNGPVDLDDDTPTPTPKAAPAAPKAAPVIAWPYPTPKVDQDDTPLQPITRATLTSMGPAAKPTPKAALARKTAATKPSTKASTARQPRGPF